MKQFLPLKVKTTLQNKELINIINKLYKNFVANNNVLERKTSWGKIQIRNRLLTQYHNDVLGGIMALKNKTNFK